MGEEKKNTCVCVCGHHDVIPVLMILFAVLFLLGYQGVITSVSVNTLWPIFVGLAGVVKLTEKNCRCC